MRKSGAPKRGLDSDPFDTRKLRPTKEKKVKCSSSNVWAEFLGSRFYSSHFHAEVSKYLLYSTLQPVYFLNKIIFMMVI